MQNSFRVWDSKTRKYSDSAFLICSAGDLWESIEVHNGEKNQLIVEPVDEKRFKVEHFSGEVDKAGRPAYINDVFVLPTPGGPVPYALAYSERTNALVFKSLVGREIKPHFCSVVTIVGTTHDDKKKLLKAAEAIDAAERAAG